jgi:peptidoglycan/xylan/chitin deacetylase (PgdA/CDA1 family)
MARSERAVDRRWRPAPALAGSVGLHCVACAAAIVVPEQAPWALATVAGNHLVLGAAGLWPRSSLLGRNVTRLPAQAASRGEVALTFDDGPHPQHTPRMLDLLQARGVRATFFCVAAAARTQRELVREIVRRGHRVENHSLRHRATFPLHSVRGFRAELSAAQEILAELTGRAPRFFRAPAGLRNPLLDPALQSLGLTLVSWTRRGLDARDGNAATVMGRLTRGLRAGDILVLHDGGAARTRSGTPVSLEVLPRVLDALAQARLRPVTLHEAITP